MNRWFRLARKALAKSVRRFLNSAPANQYEGIVFDALRTAAVVFGEGKGKIA